VWTRFAWGLIRLARFAQRESLGPIPLDGFAWLDSLGPIRHGPDSPGPMPLDWSLLPLPLRLPLLLLLLLLPLLPPLLLQLLLPLQLLPRCRCRFGRGGGP
jgi:hypothetical protein